ncbi:hypothetical protein DH2020_000383 [Rehmannia glutinosa]|uniref:Tf2-1-like SH3-like domain-containing protein n=1 Tax=Rehmannia glutinosa TaxID=99300 RepID=A0ABR0XWG4_REHGL
MSDRDPHFTLKFWGSLHTAMKTNLVLDLDGSWETYLPLVEFAYNNSYQAIIQMAPYEALYGRKCRSPAHWVEVGERKIFGPEIIKKTVGVIAKIRDRIKATQDRQKSYADRRRKDLQFEILERIGDVAYRLTLPLELAAVHNVFHISMLRKYISDPSHIINHEELDVSNNLTYEESPVAILGKKVHKLRNREVPLVLVQWSQHGREEATWEREEEILTKYPNIPN